MSMTIFNESDLFEVFYLAIVCKFLADWNFKIEKEFIFRPHIVLLGNIFLL